jgi:hypothetical protein
VVAAVAAAAVVQSEHAAAATAWWLMMRWHIRKQLLWRWLDVNHLMTPVKLGRT